MPLILNGSTGISGTDGSAGTPAVQGTDGNTGMFFPAADQIAFAEGGVEAMRLDASGNVGIGTSSPGYLFTVNGQASLNQIILPGAGANYVTAPAAGSTIVFQTVGLDRAAITATGDFQFNSGYGSVATAFGCRAWVNFNGEGTIAVRASGNVSSLVDNGTGDYTVNLTNAMPDANFCTIANGRYDTNGTIGAANTAVCMARQTNGQTTTSTRVVSFATSTGVALDFLSVTVAIFR